jgi:hypothetical protein
MSVDDASVRRRPIVFWHIDEASTLHITAGNGNDV